MFDTVEYLKTAHFTNPDIDDVDRIAKLCEEHNIGVRTLLQILVKYCRQRCINNCIDSADYGECTDDEGQNVAFGLDEIAEAYGFDRERIRCSEINSKGCCAKINSMMSNLEWGLYDYIKTAKDETGRQISGSASQE